MNDYLKNYQKANPINQNILNPQQKNSALSANPSAVNPVVKTPAAQSFIASLSPEQVKTNQANDMKTYFPNGVPGSSSVSSNQGSTTGNTGSNNSSSTDSTSDSSTDPYIRYLTGQFDPARVDSARKKYEDEQQRLSDIQSQEDVKSLGARREQDQILDTPGGLLSGANQAAKVADRRSNSELADLAVQENAASRSTAVAKDAYDTAINAGKTVSEAKAAADKSAQEQKNTEVTQKLSQDKFNEDTRQFGLTYAQNQQKIDTDKANSNTPDATQKAGALSSVNLINTLLDNPAIDAISGFEAPTTLIPGTNAQLAKNQFNQLKGILSLENRSKLKGQGAVSDFEGKTLDRAASALDRNLSDADFKKQLKQVKGAISSSNGLPVIIVVTDPKTGQSQTLQSDSAGIAHAIEDGNLVEYQ